jgi:hypothetical protein
MKSGSSVSDKIKTRIPAGGGEWRDSFAVDCCTTGSRGTPGWDAANTKASGRAATIDVKPGRYVEGVIVCGHAHDGLRIIGMGKKPGAVLLEGRNAHGPGGAAQNAVEGDNVNNLVLENMKAEHYAANGFFINSCRGYEMKDLVAAFNRAYGLYVFRCVGGRMTQSVGYGQGVPSTTSSTGTTSTTSVPAPRSRPTTLALRARASTSP